MGLTRKDFLLSSAGLLAAAGGISRSGFKNTPTLNPMGTNSGNAMLYDSSKCIGCRMCEEGCINENSLSHERVLGRLTNNSYTAIQTVQASKKKNLFLKLQCMHCTEASCEAVCPTGAASHRGESVIIDQDVCIGCGYCEKACPFGVPHRAEEPAGAAKKCTFCINRVESGSKTACAEACPIDATTFGARSDLLPAAKTRVQTLKKTGWPDAQLYGEDQLGGLNMLYILLKPPAFYGIPENPKQATNNVAAQWTSGGIAFAALVAPFWFLYKRMTAKDKDNELETQKEGSK